MAKNTSAVTKCTVHKSRETSTINEPDGGVSGLKEADPASRRFRLLDGESADSSFVIYSTAILGLISKLTNQHSHTAERRSHFNVFIQNSNCKIIATHSLRRGGDDVTKDLKERELVVHATPNRQCCKEELVSELDSPL
jgi:hypothetical protein